MDEHMFCDRDNNRLAVPAAASVVTLEKSRSDYWRAYYQANRERLAEQKRAYREANRERLAEQKRANAPSCLYCSQPVTGGPLKDFCNRVHYRLYFQGIYQAN